MSGSVYNEGLPFNPALFLYLQPDIQVRENIKTVEEAVEYYKDKKDDPTYTDEKKNMDMVYRNYSRDICSIYLYCDK